MNHLNREEELRLQISKIKVSIDDEKHENEILKESNNELEQMIWKIEIVTKMIRSESTNYKSMIQLLEEILQGYETIFTLDPRQKSDMLYSYNYIKQTLEKIRIKKSRS